MSDISIFNENDIYFLLGICSIGVGFFLTIALVVLNFLTKKNKKFTYYVLMFFIYCILSFASICFLHSINFF
ncbi:hypothetical protein SAMN02787073_4893 [Chryseobacterium vrystaatense]|uniref:Uncharacterized protein n=1 Tax=Chryseobacterium vrystaatense TaxID=307480 RepID=A0A1M5MYB6_9FLAO|nr:hypothetical protein SAMN02787073_4893 [Chryseobacterium vrystaatense]